MHVGKDDLDVGDGDQGILFGYAGDEPGETKVKNVMIGLDAVGTLTPSTATLSGKNLTDVRKSEDLWWWYADAAGGDSAVNRC